MSILKFQDKKALALTTVLIITMLMFMCSRNSHTESLSYVDSLLVQGQYQLALDSLQRIDTEDFKKGELAYYSLLMTQAKYKNHIAATSDSMIKVAIEYYNQSPDHEKYSRSLIYQGCVNEDLGKFEKAVECYKAAEEKADKDDLRNRAFATFRLACLYHSQLIGAKTIAVKKYKEALKFYEQLHDQHYQMICLGEIGSLYRERKEKWDSVLYYLNAAIKLSEELPNEEYSLFSYYTIRGQFHNYVRHDYIKAKRDVLKAISSVDSNQIDHARAHICLADAYIHLGLKDSCDYYLNRLPPMASSIDTLLYHDLLADIYQYSGDIKNQYDHNYKAIHINDSVLMHSINHRLLAVEKEYDLQLSELENAKLQSKLKNSWLILFAFVAIAFGLLSIVLIYRHRLRDKEYEFELLRSDLDSSIDRLKQAQSALNGYEEDLFHASATISKLNNEISEAEHQLSDMEAEKNRMGAELDDSQRNVYSLNKEIAEMQQELIAKQQDRDQLSQQIADLESKKVQSDEIKAIIDDQIKVLHELMQWAYELDGASFTRKFNSLMTMQSNKQSATYWDNLQSLVNDLYDNILVKAQEQAGGTLRDDELNFIALYCCGFSRTAIMVCMNYKHIVTISNKKAQISKKLGINIDDFVGPHQH